MKTRTNHLRFIGLIGAIACLVVYVRDPSFPTPDKLFIFLLFVFMAFNQVWEYLKRFVPFLAIILIYESFRGLADQLNTRVHYGFAPHIDKLLFGNLPTVYFQRWLWRGHVSWYDIVLYIPYLMFFLVPFGLAVLVWKTKDKYYWEVMSAYGLLFFGAYLTFLILPAAPPWLASEHQLIQPITRISSDVWFSMGIHNFPSVYNHLSPNPVAAFPSLHAGVSALFSMLVFKYYGRRWGSISLIYPILLCFGVIYEGEHYATDVIAGIIYAAGAFYLAPRVLKRLKPLPGIIKAYSSNTKSA